jgi:hypothetical protein
VGEGGAFMEKKERNKEDIIIKHHTNMSGKAYMLETNALNIEKKAAFYR